MTTTTQLNTEQKKHLRRLGHNLHPIVTVAGNGLTENIHLELERALNDHELFKVKLAVGDKDAKSAVIDAICQQHNATAVQTIGHIVLLYRKAAKPNPRLSNLLR